MFVASFVLCVAPSCNIKVRGGVWPVVGGSRMCCSGSKGGFIAEPTRGETKIDTAETETFITEYIRLAFYKNGENSQPEL
jgi:hypothetical protein